MKTSLFAASDTPKFPTTGVLTGLARGALVEIDMVARRPT